jgi:hypothetical protein
VKVRLAGGFAADGSVFGSGSELHSSPWMEKPLRQKRNKEKNQDEYE